MGRRAGAAVLFLHVGAEKACFAEAIPELAWDHSVLFPLLIVRCNLLLKGAARHIPEQGQLVQINGLIHFSAPSSFGRTRSMKKLCRQHKTPSERYR